MESSGYEWIGQFVMERRSLMNNRKRVGDKTELSGIPLLIGLGQWFSTWGPLTHRVPRHGKNSGGPWRAVTNYTFLNKVSNLNVFWCSMHQSYPKVSEIALRLLLPFSITYLCESGFSTLLQITSRCGP